MIVEQLKQFHDKYVYVYVYKTNGTKEEVRNTHKNLVYI